MTARIRTLLSTVAIAMAVYAGICAYFYFFQRSLLYYPTPQITGVNLEPISVGSGVETIHVWRSRQMHARALIYFGGNAEPVALSEPQYRHLFPQHTVYLMEYRGYGQSTGKPTEAGLSQDALAVFDTVATHHDRIVVVGRSLGSGLATHVAANRPVNGLVLITPYDSIAAVARTHFAWLPVGWLLHDRYDSAANAARISERTLIVAADRDQVIPVRHAQQLAAAFSATQPKVVVVPGATHDNISSAPVFSEAIESFVE